MALSTLSLDFRREVALMVDDAATVREYRLWAARTGHQVVEAGDCTAFPRAVRLRRWR